MSSIARSQESILSSLKQVADWEPIELAYNEIRIMNDHFSKNGINKIVDVQKRLDINYPNLLKMDSRYNGENINYAGYLDRISNYQIFAFEGKLYDSQGTPVNTGALNFDRGAIMVMDSHGNLFLTHKKRGEIHHSTFLASAPVAYACMLEVRNGEIIQEESWSGHYLPNSLTQLQFHDRLRRDFIQTFDSKLKCIFLSVFAKKFEPEHMCAISRSPLFEAVKLPCGHSFNQKSLQRWSEARDGCPMDGKPYEMSTVAIDIETRTSLHKSYKEYLEKIKSNNAALDSRWSN